MFAMNGPPPPGQPQSYMLRDMLGGVGGLQPPGNLLPYEQPRRRDGVNYFYGQPVMMMTYPESTSSPNEITEPLTDPIYIREVGSTPGTLDRMKRIVVKQTSCYGMNPQYFNPLTWSSRTKCRYPRVARCRIPLSD
jgi:hypothetical protein